MSFVGATINVRGVVQGVGFRYWCHRKAQEFPIVGYVANLPDGSVEVVAEGDRGVVEEFIKILRVGPTYADISDLKITWYEKPRGYDKFFIAHKG